MSDGPRPTGLDGAPPFVDGLTGEGLRDVELFAWSLEPAAGHGCTVTSWIPRAPDRVAPAASWVLAREPDRTRVRSWTDEERALFELDGQTMRARVMHPEGTSCYGLGLAMGGLERTGRTVELWNTDAWCYGDHTRAVYQSHPFVLCLLPDGTARGVLALTPRRGLVTVAPNGVELSFEREPFELAVLEGPGPLEVVRCLSSLAGGVADLPVWALGYHQCRWGYASAEEFRSLAREFRTRGLPCDALWFDIDYMDAHRVFTFDGERFPDPAGLLAELGAEGFRTVAILDPGLARGTEPYRQAADGAHLVTDPAGDPVHGRVWPGVCGFPDFLAEGARAWWAGRVERFLGEAPFDGLWCDMNEPSLFRTPSGTLPVDTRHASEPPCDHGFGHNLYGAGMARATRTGFEAARPGATPFVLSRANHTGGSRYAAAWTGDNQARWEDLRHAVAQVANLGACGQPISGPDVGGFNGEPDPELFVRWFELGLFLPFFRGHSERTACRKEPWSFGPEVEAKLKRLLEERQAWLPTWLALARDAVRTGTPIVRPLAFLDPTDVELRGIDDAFLVGDSLLVAPVLAAGMTERDVRLPDGAWYVWGTRPDRVERGATLAAPLGVTPLLVRAGSILLRAEPGATVDGTADGARELHVFMGDGGAQGTIVPAWSGGEAASTVEVIEVTASEEAESVSLVLSRPLRAPLTIAVYGGTASTHATIQEGESALRCDLY